MPDDTIDLHVQYAFRAARPASQAPTSQFSSLSHSHLSLSLSAVSACDQSPPKLQRPDTRCAEWSQRTPPSPSRSQSHAQISPPRARPPTALFCHTPPAADVSDANGAGAPSSPQPRFAPRRQQQQSQAAGRQGPAPPAAGRRRGPRTSAARAAAAAAARIDAKPPKIHECLMRA